MTEQTIAYDRRWNYVFPCYIDGNKRTGFKVRGLFVEGTVLNIATASGLQSMYDDLGLQSRIYFSSGTPDKIKHL